MAHPIHRLSFLELTQIFVGDDATTAYKIGVAKVLSIFGDDTANRKAIVDTQASINAVWESMLMEPLEEDVVVAVIQVTGSANGQSHIAGAIRNGAIHVMSAMGRTKEAVIGVVAGMDEVVEDFGPELGVKYKSISEMFNLAVVLGGGGSGNKSQVDEDPLADLNEVVRRANVDYRSHFAKTLVSGSIADELYRALEKIGMRNNKADINIVITVICKVTGEWISLLESGDATKLAVSATAMDMATSMGSKGQDSVQFEVGKVLADAVEHHDFSNATMKSIHEGNTAAYDVLCKQENGELELEDSDELDIGSDLFSRARSDGADAESPTLGRNSALITSAKSQNKYTTVQNNWLRHAYNGNEFWNQKRNILKNVGLLVNNFNTTFEGQVVDGAVLKGRTQAAIMQHIRALRDQDAAVAARAATQAAMNTSAAGGAATLGDPTIITPTTAAATTDHAARAGAQDEEQEAEDVEEGGEEQDG